MMEKNTEKLLKIIDLISDYLNLEHFRDILYNYVLEHITEHERKIIINMLKEVLEDDN